MRIVEVRLVKGSDSECYSAWDGMECAMLALADLAFQCALACCATVVRLVVGRTCH